MLRPELLMSDFRAAPPDQLTETRGNNLFDWCVQSQ